MTSELNRVEPLPMRTPGAATDEVPDASAPVLRLTCPSCSAELTSMVDHAVAPAEDGKVSPVTWTTEAGVMAATLRALRASVAVTPGVESPRPVEDTSSSPQTPYLRLVQPPLHADTSVDAPETSVDSAGPGRPSLNGQPTPRALDEAHGDGTTATTDGAPAANRPQALATRRRRQGFFSRVLTVRTFRVERDAARGARDHDAAVTALLDRAASGVLSLHHHRLQGRRAEVAHVSVGTSGVFVIDARHLKGASRDLAPEAAAQSGADDLEDVRVADAMATIRAQVAVLRSALTAADLHDVRVQGLLCPSGKNLAASGAGGEGSEVRVVSLTDLGSLVTVAGPLTNDDRATLIELLKTQLTPSR